MGILKRLDEIRNFGMKSSISTDSDGRYSHQHTIGNTHAINHWFPLIRPYSRALFLGGKRGTGGVGGSP